MRWRPLWKIAEWRSAIKKGNYLVKVQPPDADFAGKKLSEVAEALTLSTEELIQKMERLELVVEDPDGKFIDVARANKTSAEEIFIKLTVK